MKYAYEGHSSILKGISDSVKQVYWSNELCRQKDGRVEGQADG